MDQSRRTTAGGTPAKRAGRWPAGPPAVVGRPAGEAAGRAAGPRAPRRGADRVGTGRRRGRLVVAVMRTDKVEGGGAAPRGR
eukprot:1984365-Prymnesium_polylepis.1